MKSNNILKLYRPAILVLFFTISSCANFLETPPKDTYAEGNFYVNAKTAQLAVNSCYNVLNEDYIKYDWQSQCSDLDQGSSTFNSYILTTVFQQGYTGIHDCNVALKYIPGIDFKGNDVQKKDLIAQARTLRALYYYTISVLIGPVPLITTDLEYLEYAKVERPKDITIIRNFMISELNAAIPDLYSKTTAEKGRVTKDFARYLAAQVYMLDHKWTEAEKLLKEIITSNNYSLLPNYENVCSYDTKGAVCSAFEYTAESLFEIGLIEGDVTFSERRTDCLTPLNCSGNDYRALEKPMDLDYYQNVFLIKKEVVSRTLTRDTTWVDQEYGKFQTAKAGARVSVNVFTEDPRRKNTVYCFGDKMICMVQPGVYVDYTSSWFADGNTLFLKRKYWPTSSVTYGGRRGMNYIVARYAHVLLDYAEVQYRLGNNVLAYEYMNKVRERAWTGYPRSLWERTQSGILYPDAYWNKQVFATLSAKGYDKTFIDLMHEYFLEFGHEGQTTQLMMRWGKREDVAVAFGAAPESVRPEQIWYAYPQEEIDKNPSIWQNPGF